jgi:hypothetical protein
MLTPKTLNRFGCLEPEFETTDLGCVTKFRNSGIEEFRDF